MRFNACGGGAPFQDTPAAVSVDEEDKPKVILSLSLGQLV